MPLCSSGATQALYVTPAQKLEEFSSLGMGVEQVLCSGLGAGATLGILML